MRRARISQHHCKIPFAAAVKGYFQFAARPERHVLFAVGGRAAVRSAVYPVHGEVAFVLRPLPVVYISSEGGDAQWRSGDDLRIGVAAGLVFPIVMAVLAVIRKTTEKKREK